MTVARRVGALVACLFALLVVVGDPAGTPVGAQDAELDAELEIVDQSIYVPADGTFALSLRWSGPWTEDLRVSATVFAPLEREDQIDEPPGSALNRYPAAASPLTLDTVTRSAEGVFTFEVPIRSFSAGDDRVWLSEAGVYPVTVEVRTIDGPVASTRTNLVHLPGETAEIQGLDVAFVLNVSSADGIELIEAIRLLTDHPSLPIMVVLESGVLTQLAGDPDLAAAFVTALGERRVTGEPILGLDPSALAAIEQGDLYAGELEQFWNRFELVGLQPERSTLALNETVTEAGADLLLSLGVERVVDLDASDSNGSIHTSDGGLAVIAVDQESTSALRRSPNAVIQAHELLARLSIRRSEATSPVILGGAEVRLVSSQALDVLFTALEQPGAIESVPLPVAVERTPELAGALPTTADQSLLDAVGKVAELRSVLATYEQFHAGGSPTPTELERALLSSLAVDRNAADREVDLSRVEVELQNAFDVISLPERQSINLAARNRAIPLSITNDAPGERNVLLRFTSDRIEVTQDETIVAIPPGSSAIEIDVIARSLGVSPLDVEVLTPDGRQVLASTRFRIRSTAVPGLGYLLSGAALVFLIAWWIVSFTRTRALDADAPRTDTDAEASDDPVEAPKVGSEVGDAVTAETSSVGDR